MTTLTAPSPDPVYQARPRLEIDGTRADLAEEHLVLLDVVEAVGGLSRCEAEFSNVRIGSGAVQLAFEGEDSILRFGVQLVIGLGPSSGRAEIFRGRITGLEGRWANGEEPRLTILAEDALVAGRLCRRSKTYPEGTLKALIEAIASQLHLTPSIDGCTQAIGVQAQLDESDLAFLRRVVARYDVDVQIVGETLQAAPRANISRNVLRLGFPDQLIQVRVLADLAHQVSQVTCTGWDATQGQPINVTSGAGADRGPAGQGMRGSEVLERALGGRRSEHLGPVACADAAEAQALADAHAAARGRRFVTIEGICRGDHRLRVGSHVQLPGLGGRFSTTAYVVRVRHRFDQQHGYRCDFTAESSFFAGGEP